MKIGEMIKLFKENHKVLMITISTILLFIIVGLLIYTLNTHKDSFPEPEELPRDFPIHPQAVEEYGYTAGVITHYTYNIPLSSEEVRSYYDSIDESVWLVEKNWFEQGDGEQKHFKTEDYNPKPGEKAGRSVQVILSSNEVDDTTKLIIVATINS
ncbi:hypothetical protein HOK51_01665 [Candidatus Woesearchaeota archaeon]|jgi:hypothetical protein|nr:hypothetical protein [Candidatus Woesearchaeota archaeon]MBT6518522.1 hypothetical protein [Candidatus Woesearchaeota archaeon]MBT7368394.1 hypothetical protein [Candidatus Woesearchaeota archaeon]